MGDFMKINWTGFATTRGRQAYSRVLGENIIPLNSINYDGGFLIGWDQWSDGNILYNGTLFR